MTLEQTDATEREHDVLDALMDCYNPAPLRSPAPAQRWEDDNNKDETDALRLPVCCYDD
jgi:hypothetical protein